MKNLIVVVGSVMVAGTIAACPAPEPPKVVEVDVVDAGAAVPIATTATPAAPLASARPSSGRPRGPKAPSVAIDSITTPGKITIPAGQVGIVDFWATWCEPCKKSFPKLQELYVKHKASGLEIIAISVDDESKGIAAFAKTYGAVTFPIGWDKGHKLASAWTVESMPSTYIVDKDGNIAHVHKGYRDGEIGEIEREIKALF